LNHENKINFTTPGIGIYVALCIKGSGMDYPTGN
jgi:hypothetical protein